jgi:L-ascorbate metabolism protein UlaG (beta-lactamase superfamily)
VPPREHAKNAGRISFPCAILGSAMERRGRIGRRGLLVGAAATLGGAALLEYESFQGRFDHRRSAGASGARRYAAALVGGGGGLGGGLWALDRAGKEGVARASVVHVGHSTHLLAVGGLRLLTDPWFHDPAFGALAHEVPPAVLPTELGRLDVVLVTHDHADHADARAMDQMDKRARVFVATEDLAARIRHLGYREVTVLAPWEEAKLADDVTVTAVPGLHDIYEIGFVVKGGGIAMYFAGDSRLHPDIPAIAERFAPDVSILSCDGTRLAGGALHVMTPEDAVVAARALKSRLVIPSHAEAVFSDPIAGHLLASTVARARFVFAEAMGRALPGVRCVVPGPGELVPLVPIAAG